jgi:urease accessory protein
MDRSLAHDPDSLERWVRFYLRHALGPCEGIVVAAVCRAARENDWPTVLRANQLLWVSLVPPTLRHASRDMGEQLLGLAEVWPWAAHLVHVLRESAKNGGADEEWHHAVAFATLASAAGAVPAEALLVYLNQAALGVIGAGVRAIPIGHTHGQQILARLHGDLETLARELAERDLDTVGSFCPAYEVLCDAQRRLYTRLFRS